MGAAAAGAMGGLTGAATLLCCAVSQEHNMLCAAGTDKRIHVWDTRTMKKVHEFASHRGAVTGLAIRDGTGQISLKEWSTGLQKRTYR